LARKTKLAMQLRKRLRVVVLLFVVFASALAIGYIISAAPQPPEVKIYPRIGHSPISIQQATDFTPPNSSAGCACVVSGSGSSGDPYVIAGWDINASETNGISVSSVDKYFIITQVRISGTQRDVGISFDQIQNARISNSTIIGTFVAISLFESNKVTIQDNVISQSEYGVSLEASDSNTVFRNGMNTIGQVSVFVRGSDNLVEANTIDGSYGAINLDGTPRAAARNMIKNNTIRLPEAYGIGLWRASDNKIIANTIADGGGVGILLTASSSGNTIENNNVRRNTADGILINKGSSSNLVQKNIFMGNGDGGSTFDLHSEESSNVWRDNTFETRKPDTLG